MREFERNVKYTYELAIENGQPVIFVKYYSGVFDPSSEHSIGFKLKGDRVIDLADQISNFFAGFTNENCVYGMEYDSLTFDYEEEDE